MGSDEVRVSVSVSVTDPKTGENAQETFATLVEREGLLAPIELVRQVVDRVYEYLNGDGE